jgi:hypothetical protein
VSGLSAAEALRLRTFAPDIAKSRFPPGTRSWVDGHDVRFPGGLAVHLTRGCWFNWETGEGGDDTVDLIRHIGRLVGDPRDDHEDFALAWLASHSGLGSCGETAPDEDDTGSAIPASRVACERIIPRETDLSGTAGWPYYDGRGIDAALAAAAGIRFVEYARCGEHGVSAPLVAKGRIVGRTITYITLDGQKTPLKHCRDTFLLEQAKDAVFEIAAPTGVPPDTACDLAVGEGVEDALSLAMLRRGFRIFGLIGVGKLARISVAANTRVTVFCDGDGEDHPARKGLIAGLDHLLLQKASVRLTDTPPGQDPNALLQKSLADMLSVFAAAKRIELSFHGECRRLAKIDDPFERALARKAVAKKFKVSERVIDATVKKYEPAPRRDEGGPPPYPADEPFEGDVDIRAVLDAALVQVARYIVAPEHTLAVLVLWCAHAHIVHNEKVRLQRSPRLAIQASERGAGKSTTLEIVACLTPRSDSSASYTTATIYRDLALERPTLCLDEADTLLTDDGKKDIVSVLNIGDRRNAAIVKRSVPLPKGGWRTERFNVFGAVAIAGVGELPEGLQERSVRFYLRKARGDQVPEHLRDGTSPELVDLRRQLAKWNEDLVALPEDPRMPDILLRQAGRTGDAWRPLFAIAEVVGGRWPDLGSTAVLAELGFERQLSVLEELSNDIYAAYEAEREKHEKLQNEFTATGRTYDANDYPDNPERLRSKTLVQYLIDNPNAEWDRKNRGGKEITAYWVARQLRGLLTPPGTQDWWTGRKGSQVHHSGYLREQFEGLWETHPPPQLKREPPLDPTPEHDLSPGKSGVSGVAGVPADFPRKSAEDGTPDEKSVSRGPPDPDGVQSGGTPNAKFRSSVPKPAETLAKTGGTPGKPDTPTSRGEKKTTHIKARSRAGRSKPIRDKSNGSEPALDLPAAPVGDYPPDGIATAIHQLHAQYPKRSLRWLSDKTGQPKSIIEAVLRANGGLP